MAYLSEALRRQVFERAQGRCEYCQTQQVIVIVMEVDHIIPRSRGGQSALDNLCLACVTCNSAKLSHIMGIDPITAQEVALYNPRTQVWGEHFGWSDDGLLLEGRTETGRATVERLRVNERIIVAARKRWVEAGWHPPGSQPESGESVTPDAR